MRNYESPTANVLSSACLQGSAASDLQQCPALFSKGVEHCAARYSVTFPGYECGRAKAVRWFDVRPGRSCVDLAKFFEPGAT